MTNLPFQTADTGDLDPHARDTRTPADRESNLKLSNGASGTGDAIGQHEGRPAADSDATDEVLSPSALDAASGSQVRPEAPSQDSNIEVGVCANRSPKITDQQLQNWLQSAVQHSWPYARRLAFSVEEAEDFSQEAAERTWRRRDEFPGETQIEFHRWYRGFLRHVRLEAVRDAKTWLRHNESYARSRTSAESNAVVFEQDQLDRETREQIEKAPLGAEEKAVLQCRFYEDRPCVEIAAICGVSLRTVLRRLASAFDKLRIMLGDRS